jgi:hypothetical protein
MNMFRLLRADEIECRIAQISKSGKGLSLLLYKTARTDANILDETVGPENWENDFKLVDGVLYGGIGVNYGGKMVWKWDAGVESNTEAEKGRASDAFKRAGFKHGIGRELYTAPFIWVKSGDCTIEKVEYKGQERWVCNDRFEVGAIEYDAAQNISGLVILRDGVPVYEMRGQKPKPEEPPKTETANRFKCARCGKNLLPYLGKDGKPVSLRAHAERSMNKFGQVLCLDCIKEA